MNGWQRIGILLSAIWLSCVVGYAIYERLQLPISWFGTELSNPRIGWDIAARDLYLIDITSRPAGDTQQAIKRVLDAKTDEERSAAVALWNQADSPIFGTKLKTLFWWCLLAPIAGLWCLSYAAVYIWKWVWAGFSSHGMSSRGDR